MPETILGKYKLLEPLGKGGFGTVYKATDNLGRSVAVKVLKPGWSDDPETIARFQREARSAGELFHPRIVTILDFDEVDGRRFLVMRYIDGPSLDKLLAQRGRLPWDEAVRLLSQVAEGLDYAHQHGFIHRDIKPANILVHPQEGAVLTDFGLVKAAQSSGLSTSGVLLGTPNYIAPEIWQGQEVSPATDVYSLACVFYEMITGETLFKGDSAPQVMTQHMLEGSKFPDQWAQDIPPGIELVLRQGLAQKAEDRFMSGAEFVHALQYLKTGEPKEAFSKQPTKNGAESLLNAKQNPQAGELPEPAKKMNIVSARAIRRRERKQKLLKILIPAIFGVILIVGVVISITIKLMNNKNPEEELRGMLTPTPSETTLAPTKTAALKTITPSLVPHTNTPVFTIETTHTPAPNPSPTPEAPVSIMGVLLQSPLKIITPSNAWLVQELTRWDKGIYENITWSPDGRLLAAGTPNGSIQIWQVYDGGLLHSIEAHPGFYIWDVIFSPDGKILASASDDGNIGLWNVADGSMINILRGHTLQVLSLAFSTDGQLLASASSDQTVQVWNVSDGSRITIVQGGNEPMTSVSILSDGETLVAGSTDRQVRVWNISEGKLLRTWDTSSPVNQIAFSPDEKKLASISTDNFIMIWQFSDGNLLNIIIEKQTTMVTCLAFSPDGNILASGSLENTISLRQISDGKLLQILKGHTSDVNGIRSIAFSPDGALLVSAAWDDLIRLWGVSP